MKRIFLIFIFISILTFAFSINSQKAYSDELDEIGKKIAELQSALSSSQQATAPFLTQLTQLRGQLDNITNQVNATPPANKIHEGVAIFSFKILIVYSEAGMPEAVHA